MKTAWLITPPHPDPAKRRRIVRRIGGKLVTVFRVPVKHVEVLHWFPGLRVARVRDRTGSEYYGRLDCLASTRIKFIARYLAIAGVIPDGLTPSGVFNRAEVAAEHSMPATTASDRQA